MTQTVSIERDEEIDNGGIRAYTHYHFIKTLFRNDWSILWKGQIEGKNTIILFSISENRYFSAFVGNEDEDVYLVPIKEPNLDHRVDLN